MLETGRNLHTSCTQVLRSQFRCPSRERPERSASRLHFWCQRGSNRFGLQMGSTALPRVRSLEGHACPQGVAHSRLTGGCGSGSGGSGGACDNGRDGSSGCMCCGGGGISGGDGATATRRRGRRCGWFGCVVSSLQGGGRRGTPFSRRGLGGGSRSTRTHSRVPRPLLEAQQRRRLALLHTELLPAAAARWHGARARRRRGSNCVHARLPPLFDSTLRATRIHHKRMCARATIRLRASRNERGAVPADVSCENITSHITSTHTPHTRNGKQAPTKQAAGRGRPGRLPGAGRRIDK